MNLIAERRNRGLSRRTAAEQMKVSLGVLERAENGLGVHPHNALKIATFYDVNVTDIWPVDEDDVAA